MSVPNPTIQKIEKEYRRATPLPEFRVGDTVKVWVRIREGDKTRLQAFEGVCITRHRADNRSSFTVRKISYGVGVERIFPDNSPNIDRVEVRARGRVRQGRLYYLRDLTGKAARIKERGYEAEVGEPGEIVDVDETAVAAAKAAAKPEPTKAETKAAETARKAKAKDKKESRREAKKAKSKDKKSASASAE